MTMFLSITAGFVTNSSSVIHHVPREFLDHPDVQKFMEILGIQNGFVGERLWNRQRCATVAVTREQKLAARRSLESINDNAEEGFRYSIPDIDVDGDDIVIVYCDETTSAASSLAYLLEDLASERGLRFATDSYN